MYRIKRYRAVLLLLSPAIVLMVAFRSHPPESPADRVEVWFHEQALVFEKHCDTLALLSAAYEQGNADLPALMGSYYRTRAQYRHIETIAEYFYPATAESINGPLVNEADEEEGTQHPILPEGLQVIESLVYDEAVEGMKDSLRNECKRLLSYARRLSFLSATVQYSDWQIMEAAKHELVRIFILSLAGYDIPASGRLAPEAIQSLNGLRQVMLFYKGTKGSGPVQRLVKLMDKATGQLMVYADADPIDRYLLIRDYMNPLFAAVEELRRAGNFTGPPMDQPMHTDARSYWETGAYNLAYFSRYDRGMPVNPDRVELGRTLFFDPVLSGNGQRSCGSCHRTDRGFTDGLPRSLAFESNGFVTRNAPSLLHVAFQNGYFVDSRAGFLEDQVQQVMENPEEMHGSLKDAIVLLRQSAEYRMLFRKAFAGTADTVITGRAIVSAIASYERSLFRLESRFDKDIRGEGKFLTENEIAGFNIFMGKGLCGTCHFPPAFNGTLPPGFTKTESEVIGVPSGPVRNNARIDPDSGRGKITGLHLQDFAFKTPTVRNAAITGPYMHNGVFATLREVMDFYNDGGGGGWHIAPANQTLPFDSLRLSETEISQLVDFIGALTDTAGLGQMPKRLPRIEGQPQLDNRPVGGVY